MKEHGVWSMKYEKEVRNIWIVRIWIYEQRYFIAMNR